jgi:hypothetical protein
MLWTFSKIKNQKVYNPTTPKKNLANIIIKKRLWSHKKLKKSMLSNKKIKITS